MDLIQQKLIWLLGAASVLLLLYRLKLSHTGMKKPVIRKLKIGFALISFGLITGIFSKIGLTVGAISTSGYLYVLETVIGYVLGWSVVIAGVIEWAGYYFDKKGMALWSVRAATISESVADSLIKGHRYSQLLGELESEIKEIIACQAITFHKIQDENTLRLIYESGLTPESKERVNSIGKENKTLWTAAETGRTVASDKDLVFGSGYRLQSDDGALQWTMALPVSFEGEISGVLALYKSVSRHFVEDDAKILQSVCQALGMMLVSDSAEKNFGLVSRYREMLVMAARPFESKEPLISALIKSAKLVHGYIPFKSISLYIHQNGKPRKSEFKLSTGGVVEICSGYFDKKRYPFLYENQWFGTGLRQAQTEQGVIVGSEKHVYAISDAQNPLAHLMIELGEPSGKSSYLPLIGAALGRKIGERLEAERLENIFDRFQQFSGALNFFQEKALVDSKLPALMKQLATLVVDLAPVSFCRVMFADSKKEIFKTIGIAQARDLRWESLESDGLRLPENTLHRKALNNSTSIEFELSAKGNQKMSSEEQKLLLPDGLNHGLIIPLRIGASTVGLLTIGEARNRSRSALKDSRVQFIHTIAGLISLILTIHKEKRTSKTGNEGKKTLMFKRKENEISNKHTEVDSNFRTRINGPLASILASCEYMQQNEFDRKADFGRFVKIIERNAARIHEITLK